MIHVLLPPLLYLDRSGLSISSSGSPDSYKQNNTVQQKNPYTHPHTKQNNTCVDETGSHNNFNSIVWNDVKSPWGVNNSIAIVYFNWSEGLFKSANTNFYELKWEFIWTNEVELALARNKFHYFK